MTDSELLDLDNFRAYARAALEQARLAGGNAAVANLAAAVLTLGVELERAQAEIERLNNILAQLSPAELRLVQTEAESGLPPIPWKR